MRLHDLTTTAELVEWFDHHVREPVIAAASRRDRRTPDLELYEAWSAVLMCLHEKAWTPDAFRDDVHAFSWASAFLYRALKFQRGKEAQRRFTQQGDHRWAIMHISALESEYVEQTLSLAVKESVPYVPDLGPARDWLRQALADLTPKKRDAVQLMIVGGFTQSEAAELVGGSVAPTTMKARKHAALKDLRQAAASLAVEGVPYRVVHGHPVELVA